MTNNEPKDKDLGTQGQEDSLKGKLNQAAGKAQEKFGQLTDNEELEAKGKGKQVGGKVQDTAGKVERKVDDVLDPKNP